MTDSTSGQSGSQDPGANPFSREGSRPGDALGSDSPAPPPGPPSYPPPYQAPAPYHQPTPYEPPSSAGTPMAPPGSTPSASDWPTYPGAGQPQSQPTAPDPGAYPPAPTYPDPGYQPYAQQPAYGSNPYGGNPYQQPAGYGVSPYGYALPNHPQATTALVLGIIGAVGVCAPVGIGGFVLGGRARREIDANPGQYGGRAMATAGWVLGIISIVWTAFIVLYFVVIIIVAMTSS